MNEEYLAEIDSRIRLCLELEDKLDYLDLLFKNREISKIEYDLFKQTILKDKTEEEVRKDIENYIEKAVIIKNELKREYLLYKLRTFAIVIIILFIFLMILKPQTITGLSTVNEEKFTNITDEDKIKYGQEINNMNEVIIDRYMDDKKDNNLENQIFYNT